MLASYLLYIFVTYLVDTTLAETALPAHLSAKGLTKINFAPSVGVPNVKVPGMNIDDVVQAKRPVNGWVSLGMVTIQNQS